MTEKKTSAIHEFSRELEMALAQPNRDDFIQFVGAAILGLGVNGFIDNELGLKICTRMRIGEK